MALPPRSKKDNGIVLRRWKGRMLEATVWVLSCMLNGMQMESLRHVG